MNFPVKQEIKTWLDVCHISHFLRRRCFFVCTLSWQRFDRRVVQLVHLLVLPALCLVAFGCEKQASEIGTRELFGEVTFGTCPEHGKSDNCLVMCQTICSRLEFCQSAESAQKMSGKNMLYLDVTCVV